MNKNSTNQILVIGIIFLILSVVVKSGVALTQPIIENKPDLDIIDIIIEKLEYRFYQWPDFYFYVRVENIGDSPVEKTIEVTVHAFKCIFLFPIVYVDTFQGQSKSGKILKSGETIDVYFTDDYNFPNVGVYLFLVKVNPKKTIDESNFDNNNYRERAINLGIDWIDF